jgi:hypothetical protein
MFKRAVGASRERCRRSELATTLTAKIRSSAGLTISIERKARKLVGTSVLRLIVQACWKVYGAFYPSLLRRRCSLNGPTCRFLLGFMEKWLVHRIEIQVQMISASPVGEYIELSGETCG